MLKRHQTKGRKPADFLERLRLYLIITLVAGCLMPTYADTVYRCGEAYSTSAQCGNTAATEVKPTSVLTTGAGTNTSAHDLRDAQALEKQRLQAQRQAVQAAPILISPPVAATTTSNTPLPAHDSRKGKHARKAASPYFTAVDPNAPHKKKSTAKAVPPASPP